jgi:CubicO group peptidase (beta-lactamase class C family)
VLGAPTNGLITFGKVIDGGVAGFLEITFHWPTPPSVQTLRRMQGPSLSALALLAAAPVPAADPEFSGIESFLAESVADGTVAGGTVLVLQHGEMVFKSGFGFADLERKTPFQVDTPVTDQGTQD